SVTFHDLKRIGASGAVLVAFECNAKVLLLAARGIGRDRFMLVAPGMPPVRMRVAELQDAVASALACEFPGDLESILPEPLRQAVSRCLVGDRIGAASVADIWSLELPVSAGLWSHARHQGLFARLIAFTAAYSISCGLWITAWVVAGAGVMDAGHARWV